MDSSIDSIETKYHINLCPQTSQSESLEDSMFPRYESNHTKPRYQEVDSPEMHTEKRVLVVLVLERSY